MRKINSNNDQIPDTINYSNLSDELEEITRNSNYKADGKIYRGEQLKGGVKTNTVSNDLRDKYDNKCGYCESYEYKPKVEHHRPIGKVSEGKVNNNGYYWLAYEWTNLVASCTDCNNPPYKGIKYPITKSRAFAPPKDGNGNLILSGFCYDHDEMLAEGAELLHPEYIDDPINHFSFNEFGEIKGESPQGRASVRDYGLFRDNLNVSRKAVYEPWLRRIERHFTNLKNAEITYQSFIDHVKDVFYELFERYANEKENEYTLYTRYLVENFETFFIEPFDPIVREDIRTAFVDGFEQINS